MVKTWDQMSWQEKREERFKKWLSPKDIKFSSPAAARKYRERATRMIKAIKMEVPDRIPVHIPGGSIVAYNAGYTLKDMLYDHTRIKPAWLKWIKDYDQDSNDAPMFFCARAYEILDYQVNKWPGHGLPDTATLQNFVEKSTCRPTSTTSL